MKSSYKLYLDSDGVLADFDYLAIKLLGGKSINQVPKGFLWSQVEKFDREVGPFFEHLPLMSGAETLVDFCVANFETVEVLTASGYTPKDGPAQKVRWYAKHFPHLKVNVVAKSPDKAAFASPTSILVDDRMKSIEPWLAAGGIGIHHIGVSSTITQLKKFIKESQ